MYQVRRVGVLSLAKIMGTVYGVLALIFIPIFLLVAMAGMISGEKEAALGGVAMIFLAVLMPVFYAVFGFLFGALAAWIYNLIAGRIGGIELDLQAPAATPEPIPTAVS